MGIEEPFERQETKIKAKTPGREGSENTKQTLSTVGRRDNSC